MSAEIVTLPVVRIEREPPLMVRLNPRTTKRLLARARDCRCTSEELAAMLLDEILDPRRRR